MIFEGLDDLMMEANRAERWASRITRSVFILAACTLIAVIVLLLSFGDARAQAGAGGPIPNVVGSQYLATPNNVADKQLVPIRVAPDGTIYTQLTSGTAGGASVYHVLPGASDNHAVIKNGAGTVYQLVATNNSVTANYVRLYNLGTGFNGCNSATGILAGAEILPSGGTTLSFGSTGVAFSTGLSICVTGAYGDTDTTNATNTALIVNVVYK